jgi:hypothetical protein
MQAAIENYRALLMEMGVNPKEIERRIKLFGR